MVSRDGINIGYAAFQRAIGNPAVVWRPAQVRALEPVEGHARPSRISDSGTDQLALHTAGCRHRPKAAGLACHAQEGQRLATWRPLGAEGFFSQFSGLFRSDK